MCKKILLYFFWLQIVLLLGRGFYRIISLDHLEVVRQTTRNLSQSLVRVGSKGRIPSIARDTKVRLDAFLNVRRDNHF
jgi:hypothetical protein